MVMGSAEVQSARMNETRVSTIPIAAQASAAVEAGTSVGNARRPATLGNPALPPTSARPARATRAPAAEAKHNPQ